MLGRWLRRVLMLAGVLAALWLVILAVVGELGGRWLSLRVQTSLAETLGARVRLGGIDVGLVRGHLEAAELELERKDLGAMHLVIHHAELETAPLGLALLHRDRAEALVLRGVSLALSSWAVLMPPPGSRRHLHVERFELRDVSLVLAPTLLLPTAGAVTVTIDHARGGATTWRSALSWLMSLEQLEAHAALPGGATATLRYRGQAPGGGHPGSGTLTIASSLLGAELTIPVTLPAQLSDGGELAALRALGARIGKEVAKRKAAQLLERLVR